MSKRKSDALNDLELDQEIAGAFAGPVRLRRSSRGAVPRTRSTRRKTGASRRKSNKIGGIHQRANKRTNW